ncbi:SBBP repeat-containing protein [Acanthopleuribacter pedis]|uniref:SBBP repeat-containing protein n=1 Tax=Acanthopleuribacter pedis TaxID=442870 RepID=A0A8J7QK63_9BACT|nr:SBBP repeat-containing protein [Acanthopleuribacter pedis]MBO1322466.1 SBBP repeat-containing protein [Acanthopleuribacter pedis]
MIKSLFSIILALALAFANLFGGNSPIPSESSLHRFNTTPTNFIPNQRHHKTGKPLVSDEAVVAFLQTRQGRVLFTPTGAYMAAPGVATGKSYGMKEETESLPTRKTVVFKAGFAKDLIAKRRLTPRLSNPAGTVNFFIGPPENWRTQIRTYGELVYEQVWEGVSVVYQGRMQGLAMRVEVAAHADPSNIALQMGSTPTVDEAGALRVTREGAEMVFSKPTASQIIQGQRVPVNVAYRVLPSGSVGFSLEHYNPEASLTIHPQITWSTLLGGEGGDGTEESRGIAVDSQGHAYLTGSSPNADFPVVTGAYDESWNGAHDVFVTKFNQTGTDLVYATFLGGTSIDQGFAIALDEVGNATVVGRTYSNDFPTTQAAVDRTFGGVTEAFVFQLNASGDTLNFSTLLGGDTEDHGFGVAHDAERNVYVTGETFSQNFPTTDGAYNETNLGFGHAYVCKLNATGSLMVYSTLIGGNSTASARSIFVNHRGEAYIAGLTADSTFPTTAGAITTTFAGERDGFVSKLNATGSALVYSTFLGGSSEDNASAVFVDNSDHAYVTGTTSSSDFPTTVGSFDPSFNGATDGFVVKLNSNGSAFLYATFLGSFGNDIGNDIVVDTEGQAYITGETSSSGFPVTDQAYDTTYNGSSDAYVAKLNPSGALLTYASFLGGSSEDRAAAVAIDPAGNAYVTGLTRSTRFPTTPGAFDRAYSGNSNLFLSKIQSGGDTLAFSTFFGGSGRDFLQDLAVDGAGNAYLTGSVQSNSFPTTDGVFSQQYAGNRDVHITKVDASGSTLLYATYMGGPGTEAGTGIAIDLDGNAYVTGVTDSGAFPTTPGAFDISFNGLDDVFVTKLNSTGSSLLYSTFLGGFDTEWAFDLALDNLGHAYVVGLTPGQNFPITPGAYDETYNGFFDGFVSKLNPTGSALVYSTFLGGSSRDELISVDLTSDGEAIVTGQTRSYDYPTIANGFDTSYNGGLDVVVSKLNSMGSDLIFSTFLGGMQDDAVRKITLDANGNSYVCGITFSSDFPTTQGAFNNTYSGNQEGYVTKLSSDGNRLSYSTFLGDTGNDIVYGIAVGTGGEATLTGSTSSVNFPTTVGSFDESHNGGLDAFVARLDPRGEALLYGTFLGGENRDSGFGIVLDQSENPLIIGHTNSLLFPTSDDAFDQTLGGNGDGFVAKLCLFLPEQPAAILGVDNPCPGEHGLVYSTTPVPGATRYRWTVPEGAMITAGWGTPTVTVRMGSRPGHITVAGENLCGPGPAISLAVTPATLPPQPGAITGANTICADDDDFSFRVEEITGATGYLWSVPEGAVITSGQGTATVTVIFGPHVGLVSVAAENACGWGPPQTLEVRLLQNETVSVVPALVTLCPGESARLTATSAGSPTLSYQWFKDNLPLSGQTKAILVLDAVTDEDTGAYHCHITGACGTAATEPARLSINPLRDVIVVPGSQSLGLTLPEFDIALACIVDADVAWRAIPSTQLVLNGTGVTLNPPPPITTRIEVTVTDPATAQQTRANAWLLVANESGFEDANHDGCNNIADLWELTPFWRQAFENDPDGSGFIDVRDLLYLNLGDPFPCPITKP